jgi:hypothetical protein
MWSWADRMVKAVSNVTVGTVIVLVHVALAERGRRPQPALPPDRRDPRDRRDRGDGTDVN